jgi:hypothetical protein
MKQKKNLIFLLILTMFLIHGINLFFIPNKIDPEFQNYYNSFIDESKKRDMFFVQKMKVNIKFNVDVNQKNLGRCKMFLGMKPSILINKPQWISSNESKKEMIIFHELSHCLLFRGHSNSKKTLMTTVAFNSDRYRDQKIYYINELFSYSFEDFKDYVLLPFKLSSYGFKNKTDYKLDNVSR